MVYRCLQALAPSYLTGESMRVSTAESRDSASSVGFDGQSRRASIVFQRKTFGGRAFPVTAAQTWNITYSFDPSHATSYIHHWRRSKAISKLSCSWNRNVWAWYRPILGPRHFLSAPLRSNGADYVYRHPCVATEPIMFNLLLFIYLYFFYFFIHSSFSETTRPILTKFSVIVYSGVVWIIRLF